MKFKPIKVLSDEDITKFSKFFPSGCPVSVSVSEVPIFLTPSLELRNKVRSLFATSGALEGMWLNLYRYDKNDELKGFPINQDIYKIEISPSSGAILLKVQPPFENHWLNSAPIILTSSK